MVGARKDERLLNPCVFNLQKLELELKCSVCMNLLSKPVLLPCNHMFCDFCVPRFSQLVSNCPACRQQFTDKDIRSASYMENIVTIYRSLEATFSSTVLPFLSAGNERKLGDKNKFDVMTMNGSYLEGKKPHVNPLINTPIGYQVDIVQCPTSEELEMSPGSSPSVDPKNADSDRSKEITENHRTKRSGSAMFDSAADGMAIEETNNLKEPKKQKKQICDLSWTSSSVICMQKIISHSDQAAVHNSSDECRPNKDSLVASSKETRGESCLNASICAFYQSSETNEGTGSLLHYANGREVSVMDSSNSKARTVHLKCIEWTPKVYFVGEKIKNLESELARASKLKCSSCGLKGASLGCFAKSCRRSYHFPCALKIPDCSWDCNDFLMLCPVHNSFKFPNEKSHSKKHHSEIKSCSSQKKNSLNNQTFGYPRVTDLEIGFCVDLLCLQKRSCC